ncbi:MAG: MMPL family transporter, partial [Planctomycetes bacterium]|nr:MMPL family transporter [Planctomycetota bacterium]
MSAETPIRGGFLARAIARTPGRVVILALLVVGAAGALAWNRLGIETDRMALIGDQHDYNRVFRELRTEFGDLDAMIVLVGGERAAARAAASSLTTSLAADPERFPRVFWRVPPDALGGKALLFVDRLALAEIEARLEAGQPALVALRQGGLGPFYSQLAQRIRALGRGEAQPSSAPTFLPSFLSALEGALEGRPAGSPPWEAWIPPSALAGRDGHTWTEDGRLVVLVQPPPGRGEESVASLREILAEVGAAHPTISLALTGEPVLEADELITFRADATRATLLSLLGVTVLLWFAMRRLLGPLLAVASVTAAVVTTLGAASIWPGHLNLISLALCALMLGLGIDFAIHWTSRYDDAREQGARGDEALARATSGSGRAIVAGALTTAL